MFVLVLQSLKDNKIKFSVFSEVVVEPTDESFKKAIKYATEVKNKKQNKE